jgi:hypothetical protein
MAKRSSRAEQKQELEALAEWLALEQLDLLAQVEAQLRAVHHTMRGIEKLRGAKKRIGPELSNGERGSVLQGLADEMAHLDEQLTTQAGCCHAMLATVMKMQKRVEAMKRSDLSRRSSARSGPSQKRVP